MIYWCLNQIAAALIIGILAAGQFQFAVCWPSLDRLDQTDAKNRQA